MPIAIIMVHYHTASLLRCAVASIQTELVANALNADIIVVDNSSTENERAVITRLPVRYINPGCNLGYAGAINIGVSQTDAGLLILMNSDVALLPGCLAALLQALADKADVAGPKFYLNPKKTLLLPPTECYNRPDELMRHVAKYGGRWAKYARRRWRHHAHKHWQATTPVSTMALSGALLALQRRTWDTVGPFDEGFRLYFEEVDWLRRLKQKGLTACYVPQAEAVHYYNQSAAHQPDAPRWFAESAQRFGRRYYGAWFLALTSRIFPRKVLRQPDVAQLPAGVPQIELPCPPGPARESLWIELAASPLGFPAAAARVGPGQATWQLPAAVWQRLAPDTYFIQTVDSRGNELTRVRFERPTSAAEQNQSGDEEVKNG